MIRAILSVLGPTRTCLCCGRVLLGRDTCAQCSAGDIPQRDSAEIRADRIRTRVRDLHGIARLRAIGQVHGYDMQHADHAARTRGMVPARNPMADTQEIPIID